MRVALIDPLGQYAGNHHYTDQLARGLTQAGAQVTVYTHQSADGSADERPYEYFEPFHGIYGPRHPIIRGLRFVRSLTIVLAGVVRRRTDVVHVQLWSHDIRELLQVGLARAVGKKVVITAHEVTGWSSRRSSAGMNNASPGSTADGSDDVVSDKGRGLEWMMSQAGGIVVHNKYSLDRLLAAYDPHRPVAVIPHANQAGSLGALPDRTAARARLNLPDDKFVFLFFGNCRNEKGLDLALRALAELRDEADKLLFVTAGKAKPDEEAFFRKLADELQLGDMLRMDVGFVPDDEALDYYRAANALVIPYRHVYESGVAITAASSERCVIASDLPPLLEATESGRLGLHFHSGDPSDLAHAMREALSMPAELDRRGAEAREKVLQERDPEVVGARTYALYQEVLEEKRTHRGIR